MRILVLTGCYLPGFKAGGPIRGMSNLIEHLGSEHEFYLVTRDRDLGDHVSYPGVKVGSWQSVGRAQVLYLAPGQATARNWIKIIDKVAPDVLYINSPFDVQFGVLPLLLARIGSIRLPKVISAHGIFAPNAMALKKWKKRIFLMLERFVGLMRNAEWHATCHEEAMDIKRVLSECASITTVANLCGSADISTEVRSPKRAGQLRLVFLGRLARIKNLDGALEILRDLNVPISLDIYGPLEDSSYWRECEDRIYELPENIVVDYRGTLAPSSVTETLSRYDALLLPTKNENYGFVVVEAFSAGCPVVISDRTPWRNLVESGVGWDVPLEDHAEFRRVLVRLAEMDEEAHADVRDRVLRYWHAISGMQQETEDYRRLFEKVAGRLTDLEQRRAA